ncbi:hypothetical protein RvY_02916 [Ramazzottius varieornatus]|uniref:Uncharacterized protein n=1 Tax=Ramazzottius varieornatus TaxID=947166 RepID=A0A1D1UPR4_RAMVA|nr:hypothetical protein RvY_02916 [Ramazzottius varieornatus]
MLEWLHRRLQQVTLNDRKDFFLIHDNMFVFYVFEIDQKTEYSTALPALHAVHGSPPSSASRQPSTVLDGPPPSPQPPSSPLDFTALHGDT